MKRPLTHQIDEQAQQFLKKTLPLDWAVAKQDPDYGKDYLVEIGRSGNLTGDVFFVQLKGMQSAKTKGSVQDWSFSLKSKHAKYYVDSVKDLPVFLVVVDVTQQKARWLFLQETLEKNQNWRKQTSTTLYLSAQNELKDIPLLIEAVGEAKKWMRLRHPSSISYSIESERQRLIQIDSRFDPKISYRNGELHYEMLATEDFSLQLQSLRDHETVSHKLTAMIDKGVPAQFEPGEVQILGSKLFERFEGVGCTINSQHTCPCSIRISSIDASDSTVEESLEFVGNLTGGKKEMWFSGQFGNSPLMMRMGAFPEPALTISLSLNFELWEQRPLLFLPFFEPMRAFFDSLKRTGKTRVEISVEGNTLGAGSGNLNSLPIVEWFCGFLGTLDKARKIAKHFEVNPVWSLENCDPASLRNICRLYEVQFGDGWREPAPNVKIETELIPAPLAPSLLASSQTGPADIELICQDEIRFFGQTIKIGKTSQLFTSMRIVMQTKRKRESRQSVAEGSAVRKINLVMTGNESTELIIRRATDTD